MPISSTTSGHYNGRKIENIGSTKSKRRGKKKEKHRPTSVMKWIKPKVHDNNYQLFYILYVLNMVLSVFKHHTMECTSSQPKEVDNYHSPFTNEENEV